MDFLLGPSWPSHLTSLSPPTPGFLALATLPFLRPWSSSRGLAALLLRTPSLSPPPAGSLLSPKQTCPQPSAAHHRGPRPPPFPSSMVCVLLISLVIVLASVSGPGRPQTGRLAPQTGIPRGGRGQSPGPSFCRFPGFGEGAGSPPSCCVLSGPHLCVDMGIDPSWAPASPPRLTSMASQALPPGAAALGQGSAHALGRSFCPQQPSLWEMMPALRCQAARRSCPKQRLSGLRTPGT